MAHAPKVAWHLVDAKGQVLGRLATRLATIVSGKHKPTYAPNVDCGDCVVVINAEKVALTGRKVEQKLYRWHTGYPGGLKERSVKEQFARKPEEVIKRAVNGMLPKNKMRALQLKKLRIFAGTEHCHLPQLGPDAKSIV